MNITETNKDGITIFTLQGRADTQGSVDLDLALQAAASEGRHNMVLEMSDLKYISSSGLRTLADILTQNTNAGGDLKLVSLNKKIRRVLEIVGFDKFFSMYETIDDAIAAYQ